MRLHRPEARGERRRSRKAPKCFATTTRRRWMRRTTSPSTRRTCSSSCTATRPIARSRAAGSAEMFVQAGAHYVVPDFAWVQDVGGNLLTVARQVRAALTWVARNAGSFGGDAGRIYVSGHSSGGHQAGVLAATDWRSLGLPADVVKGYVLISGMYDLVPVSLSARSNYVKFDEPTLDELSTMRHLER